MHNLIRSRWIIPATVPGIILISVFWAYAGNTTHTNQGTISAIDLKHDTVVVEVPIIDDQLMTVGGRFVEGAKLEKKNHSVSLEDFTVGDKVTVKWRSTDDGHRILALFSS
jgi:hypothetical protein